MLRGKRLFGPMLWLGVCVSFLMYSSSTDTRAGAGELVVQGPEVPLVPVPPPPLGKDEKSSTSPPRSKPPAPPTTLPPPTPVDDPAPVAASVPPTPSRPAVLAPAPVRSSVPITLRQLHRTASDSFAKVDSYIVRLTRREQVKDKMNPEELLLFKFRKEPWSVYLKWLGKEGQGREVAFVQGKHEGKIHTLLAAGDFPFVPAGRRMALMPDSLLVRAACRHPITEAGLGASINRIGLLLVANENGDRRQGTLSLLTEVRRPEFDRPVNGVENSIPVGVDPSLPRGGKRTYFFDPANGLPTLITAVNERGEPVEYYRYDRLLYPVKLDDADFDPDILWGKPRTTNK